MNLKNMSRTCHKWLTFMLANIAMFA
ncbi:MAG: hypothetical protein RL375_2804, partial [Pseudomonadota bacterium]